MTAHASIGGSTFHRLLACPGSHRLTQHAPKREAGPAAVRGTALHHVVTTVTPKTALADLVGVEHEGYTLDANDARDVMRAWHALNKFRGPAKRWQYEQRVTFPHLEDVWGTADFIGHYRDLALLADFKFGTRPVAVKDNAQLMFYAAAARASGAWPKKVKNVVLAIIQPCARPVTQSDVHPVRRIEEFADRVAHTVSLARSKDAPLKMGEHCTFCPAKNLCPAWRETSNDLGRALALTGQRFV